jgi:hypothetical protein
MAEWVPVGGGFIAADVIRWKEKVYHPRRTQRGRAVRLGERLLIAEVLQGPDSKGWVRLLVRKCESLVEFTTRKLPAYLNGAEIKRARKTIMRGNPERLLWSDESARAVVASECPAKSATTIGGSDAVSGNGSRSRRHRRRTTHPAGKAPVPER